MEWPGRLLSLNTELDLMCLVAQSYLTLCNPMDCSQPGFSVHGDSPGKNTGEGFHALLQGIFPTQGSNPGPLCCMWIIYHLSHQGSPISPQYWANGISPPGVFCHSLQMEEFFCNVKNCHFLSSERFHVRIFFICLCGFIDFG